MQDEPKYQITYTLTRWDYAAMARALTRRPWHRSIVTMVLWLLSVWCLLVLFTDLYNPVTMINAVAEAVPGPGFLLASLSWLSSR